MTINVEELVRGLGDATGLDKPKAKELASALLETVSQPLQRVGVGELKDLVPGLEALQPDVTPTPVVTPTPSEDTSQKKGLNKKEKEREEKELKEAEKKRKSLEQKDKKEKERLAKLNKGKEAEPSADAAGGSVSAMLEQATGMLPTSMQDMATSMIPSAMSMLSGGGVPDKAGLMAMLIKLGVPDDAEKEKKTEGVIGTFSTFLKSIPAVSAVYPMLMQAVPMLTQGKEGVASPTQGSTSIFTAALAPLTEAADKALRAAEAAGGVCVEGEEAAKKKTASTMKTLKERFKKLFVPNKTKTKSTREGSAPGPATPDEDAPVPSAPPMPTT